MSNSENNDTSNDIMITYNDSNLNEKRFLEHYHNTYELVFFKKANIQIFIKDRQYDIRDGDMLFIDENEIHRIIYNKNTLYARYVINFRKEYIYSLLQFFDIDFLLERIKNESCLRGRIYLSQMNEMESYFELLLKNCNKPENYLSTAIIKSTLILIFTCLNESADNCTDYMKNRKKDTQVQEIIRYIDTNYMSPIELNALANKFFISKYYLSRIFKKITGFTVFEYIQSRRIIEAQKLLKNSHFAIINICYDCGFNNLQHFYRMFKKITKLSPYKFRRSHNLAK